MIEPQKQAVTAVKPRRRLSYRVIAAVAVAIVVGFLLWPRTVASPDLSVSEPESVVPIATEDAAQEQVDRILSDSEFRQLYNNIRQPNTTPIENPPSITGSDAADRHIIELAELRGYKLRSEASGALSPVDGVRLQSDAAAAWLDMKRAAAQDGISLRLTSGFRSVADQLTIFRSRLNATGATTQNIAEGYADNDLNSVMDRAAPPGYSRHHSGYAIDMLCPGTVFERFGESRCSEWLTNDNYQNARQYGFIPSYPDDTNNQGPLPEAWEYIWVGTELTAVEPQP